MNGSVSNNRRWNIYLTTNVPIVLLAQMGYSALTGYHTKHWSYFSITVSWFCIIPVLVALYMWHDCTIIMHNKTVYPQERKFNHLFTPMLFQTCMAAVFLKVQANFILFYFILFSAYCLCNNYNLVFIVENAQQITGCLLCNFLFFYFYFYFCVFYNSITEQNQDDLSFLKTHISFISALKKAILINHWFIVCSRECSENYRENSREQEKVAIQIWILLVPRFNVSGHLF